MLVLQSTGNRGTIKAKKIMTDYDFYNYLVKKTLS